MTKNLKRSLLLGIPLLASLYYFLDPGKNILFPRCIFHSFTGLYCPGCGSQRAIHSLLHFNLTDVASNNFLLIPAVVAIGYHFSYRAANSRFNLRLPNIFYMRNTPWIIFAAIMLFWILRNLIWYPFIILAPD